MNRYFVSYMYLEGNGIGFGNCEIDLAEPVTSIKDIRSFRKVLVDTGIPDPTVMSFSRFEEPATR